MSIAMSRGSELGNKPHNKHCDELGTEQANMHNAAG